MRRTKGSEEGLLDVGEAAGYLHVSERTVWKLTAERRIGFCRIGRLVRFTREHLDAYASDNSVAVIR